MVLYPFSIATVFPLRITSSQFSASFTCDCPLFFPHAEKTLLISVYWSVCDGVCAAPAGCTRCH